MFLEAFNSDSRELQLLYLKVYFKSKFYDYVNRNKSTTQTYKDYRNTHKLKIGTNWSNYFFPDCMLHIK